MLDQEYWNPVLETLPREKLKILQFRKFKQILNWAYTRSKFHKALYDRAGLTPDDIRSFDDIKKIPKVEKSMMREIQSKDPFPYGDALVFPWKRCLRFARPAVPQDSRCTSPTPGRIGNGGPSAGRLSFGPKGTGPVTGSFFPLGIIFLWLSGPGIMRLKSWGARWFPEVFWIPSPGF